MNLFELLGEEITGYIMLGMTALCILSLVLLLVIFLKHGKLRKKYEVFMSGASGVSLEDSFVEKFDELYQLKNNVEENKRHIAAIEKNLLSTYQKIGMVKYDAFKETGGHLSFVLALLTKSNDGFILNSMHSSHEGCYTYVKEIKKGTADVVLSEEEQEALQTAVNWKSE